MRGPSPIAAASSRRSGDLEQRRAVIARSDVAIVGGGPAGLACAIEAARRGLSTVLFERRAIPCDKACGEGLMPEGLRALEALGVRSLLSPRDASPFLGVRYVQEDGSSAQGLLPEGGGLGVRRTALSEAMARRAREEGAILRERVEVFGHTRSARSVILETSEGTLEARLLIAADGLASPLRRAAGLEIKARGTRRFGVRRHYSIRPWTPFVEVYFSDIAEAYVTPAGDRRVGVAFLWDVDRAKAHASYDTLLAGFPRLAERLSGAPADSVIRGAGPMERAASGPVADRLALVGDAAGYVDAITGEGVSLALVGARALGELLPGAIARGATKSSLQPYHRAIQRAFFRYAALTRAVLALARRPALRRRVIRLLGAHPPLFDQILKTAVG
jgi:flavin-dependent dehydrogenase